MLVDATPHDRESLVATLPEYEGERLPVPVGELRGHPVPTPEGITATFEVQQRLPG